MHPVERSTHNTDNRAYCSNSNNHRNSSQRKNLENRRNNMCSSWPIVSTMPITAMKATNNSSMPSLSSSASRVEAGIKRSNSLWGESLSSSSCPQSSPSCSLRNTTTHKRPRLSEGCNVQLSIHPTAYVEAAFRANGNDINYIQQKADQQFIPPTSEMVEAYQHDVVSAFRNNDMDTIKHLHETGRLTVNACNRFGESVLHIACRRGDATLVRFLIETVGMDVKTIRDDYHRTVLHDACWTNTAASEVVDVLLDHCPEHALVKDVRGFTPFDYTRTQDHGKWLRFLWERKAKLSASSPNTDVNKGSA